MAPRRTHTYTYVAHARNKRRHAANSYGVRPARDFSTKSFPPFANDDGQAVVYSPVMEDFADDDSLYDDADVKSCKSSDVK